MPPRLARVAANKFNSVRYQPPSVAKDYALYQKLTPRDDWYTQLQQEVGRLNREAVESVGNDVRLRRKYLNNARVAAANTAPRHDSVYLRSPIESSKYPIYYDAGAIDDYQPGIAGFYEALPDGTASIVINPDIPSGRQTHVGLHELGHLELNHHTSPPSLPIKEFQAEAVARGVRERLGVTSPLDQTISAAYIADHLTALAGTGVTPRQVFGEHGDAINNAVMALSPTVARPFQRMIPNLYARFDGV